LNLIQTRLNFNVFFIFKAIISVSKALLVATLLEINFTMAHIYSTIKSNNSSHSLEEKDNELTRVEQSFSSHRYVESYLLFAEEGMEWNGNER
jgi:hypothetical protein